MARQRRRRQQRWWVLWGDGNGDSRRQTGISEKLVSSIELSLSTIASAREHNTLAASHLLQYLIPAHFEFREILATSSQCLMLFEWHFFFHSIRYFLLCTGTELRFNCSVFVRSFACISVCPDAIQWIIRAKHVCVCVIANSPFYCPEDSESVEVPIARREKKKWWMCERMKYKVQ